MSHDDGSAAALAQLALLGEATDNLGEVAVFVWDEDRNYVAANRAACLLVGRTREELLAMPVGELTPAGGEPHFGRAQTSPLLRGSHSIDGPDGPVELEWVTCRTSVAGLPYFVSVCWRKR